MQNKSAFSITKPQAVYLLQEMVLFLLVSYIVLRGGTAIGLGIFQVNLALVAVIGIGWMAWRTLRKRPFPATRLDLPILACFAAACTATVFSTDPRRSEMVLVWILLYGLAYFLLVDLIRAGLPGELIEKVFLFTSIPVVLFCWLQMYFWYQGWVAIDQWAHLIPPVRQRITAFLGQPNYLAAYFNLLIPLMVVRTVRANSSLKKLGWLAWIVVMEITLFFTASRGGWLARSAALAVLALLLLVEYRKSIRGWVAGLLKHKGWLLAVGLLLVIEIALDLSFFDWQSHSLSTGGKGLDPTSRSYIWQVAVEMFRARPLTGYGPFTFSTEFIRHFSVPFSQILEHGHNFLLDVASETGILGLAALLWLAVSPVFLVYRRWRRSDRAERVALSGVIAAVAGLAAHSMLDTPTLLPAIALFLSAFLAILAAVEPGISIPRWVNRAASISLVIGSVVLAAGMGWYVWVYGVTTAGVEAASRGDWQAAALRFDEATQKDPGNAFDWFQAGYAHGQQALAQDGSTRDRAELEHALADYRSGLERESSYATNWANYGLLEWANGDRAAALAAMQKAADGAANQPIFCLTYGRMLEAENHLEEATQAYQQALAKRPDWGTAYFFRATPFRSQVLLKWRAADLDVNAGLNTAAEAEDETQLLAGGFAAVTGEDRLENQLALGRTFSQHGETTKAIQAYQAAVASLEKTTSWGVDNLGSSPYGWVVFKQESIAPDLLPGFDSGDYTGEVITGMLDLASNLQLSGETASEASVYTKILVVAPDNESARIELAKLK